MEFGDDELARRRRRRRLDGLVFDIHIDGLGKARGGICISFSNAKEIE